MREIKFRIWDGSQYWYFDPVNDSVWMRSSNGKKNNLEAFLDESPRKDKSWEQFTGFYDKNGQEIYEGDLVIFTSRWGNELVDEIVFSNGSFYHGKNYGYCDLLRNMNESVLEVVGNINEQEKQ